MTKPIIAIDIDDVLADYADGFIQFTNEHWGTSLTIDDYDEHWANVWKVEHDEVVKRADKIHELRMIKGLLHKAEACDVLSRLSDRYQLIIVTSRRIQNKEDTLEWLKLHYPMIMPQEVTFSGFYDTISDDSVHRTKGKIVSSLGAAFLIDDQLKHCVSATKHGVQSLLFGNYSWNRGEDLPDGVSRVGNWQEVEDFFNSYG